MGIAAYYNENEPFPAQWLRNLIVAGLIAPGEVDERSIVDVQPDDVRGFTQAHFFAGIGIWSHAIRQAGWADDRPVWTGSCPCQGFSVAGAGKGFDDERHLWPEFFRLISECRPATVIGEQVASPLALAWLDLVQDDLEGEGYAVGAADLCASSVGAPHIRQRLYWVANAVQARCGQGRDGDACAEVGHGREPPGRGQAEWVANASPGRQRIDRSTSRETGHAALGDAAMRMGDACEPRGRRDARAVPGAKEEGEGQRGGAGRVADEPVAAGADGGMVDADGARRREQGPPQPEGRKRALVPVRTSPLGGFWRDAEWIACTDGKARPVEPRTCPLATGCPGRVGQLRAYGNALTAPVAQEFIEAVMECLP